MSVVLCDLFRSRYDSEHSEKVSECPLPHSMSCFDLDITRWTEEHADGEINKEHTSEA